eukprot:PhM_4_TR9293/c0_g1_i1/m.84788
MDPNPSHLSMDPAKVRRCLELGEQYQAQLLEENKQRSLETAALQQELGNMNKIREQTEVELTRAQQAASQYCSEIQSLMAQLKDVRETTTRLHNDKLELEQQRDHLAGLLDDTKHRLVEQENRLLKSESAATCQVELETRLTKQNNTISELQREVTLTHENVRTLSVELASCKRALSERERQQEEFELRMAEAQSRHVSDQDEIQRLKGETTRLREQMQTTIRNQLETLNKHLQTVEGKHRKHIDDLKDELVARSNETSAVQAKLSKAEWALSMLEREKSNAMALTTTTSTGGASGPTGPVSELLDTQQRKITEGTSKINDLTIALERSEMNARREMRQARMEIEELRAKLEEATGRVNAARRESEEAKASLERQSDELSRVYTELNGVKIQLEEVNKAKETEAMSHRRQSALSEEKSRSLLDDQAERIKTLEKKAARLQENLSDRETKSKEDIARMTEHHNAEYSEWRRIRDDLASQVKDREQRLAATTASYQEKEREVAQLQFNVQKLMQGLDSHKQQLAMVNEKNLSAQNWGGELQGRVHELELEREALRGQVTNVSRERDAAVAELTTLVGMLKRGKTSSSSAHGRHARVLR